MRRKIDLVIHEKGLCQVILDDKLYRKHYMRGSQLYGILVLIKER